MKKDLQAKIDQYTSQKMSPDEKYNFENELKTDENLRKQVQDELVTRGAIKKYWTETEQVENDYLAQKKDLKAVLLEEKKEAKIIQFSTWKWALAASIVGLTIALFFTDIFNSKNSDLFAKYYKRPVISNTLGGMSKSDEEQLFFRATKAFENQDAAFIKEITPLLNAQNPLIKDNANLMYAASLLEAKNYKDAIKYLQTIDNQEVKKEANWLLALAYLQNGQKMEAKQLLETVKKDEQNSHKTEAEAILKTTE